MIDTISPLCWSVFFLLSDLPVVPHMSFIDGREAKASPTNARVYRPAEEILDIVANPVPFTIDLPVIDIAAVTATPHDNSALIVTTSSLRIRDPEVKLPERILVTLTELNRHFTNTTEPGLRGAALTVSGSTRLLTFKDGTVWTFDGNGRLVAQRDRNGNQVNITRDGQGRVTALTEPAGRQLLFSYSGTGLQISQVSDPIGRTVRYSYDGAGRLATVTDLAGGVTTYTYDVAGRLASITDPRGITFLRNEYDANGRVGRQVQADGGVFTFSYTLTSGVVTQTVVTDPRGNSTTSRFNS